MDSKTKLTLNTTIALLALFCIPLFYHHNGLVVLTSVVIAILLFWLNVSSVSVIVYVFSFIFGFMAEYLAVHSGTWAYANPTFRELPIWVPFVWGNVALIVKNSSDFLGLILRKRK